MVEVRKKDKETSESLIRRFSRRMQESGVLMRARKTRFRGRKKNKKQLKEEALYKSKVKKEADRLRKMGIFDEEKFKDIKKKISSEHKK
jgi:ribosomal protein S21